MGRGILLTGASGFLGRALAVELAGRYEKVHALVRREGVSLPGKVDRVRCDLSTADLSVIPCLTEVGVVIHAAGLAHVLEHDENALAEFRRVNVQGTVNLAEQAAKAGVERFIFVSSIGVNGVGNEQPFTEGDTPSPSGAYAQSKWEAEQRLVDISERTGMELVILRPPLIYGEGCPGNFSKLSNWVASGVPLPFGAIDNQRTFIGVDNLISLVVACVDHPAAANQVFLAGDAEDVSTSEILRRVAVAMGKPSRLVPVPQSWLAFAARLLGKKEMAQRLLGSLRVDTSKARKLIGWQPPVSVDEGLQRCFQNPNSVID